MGKIRLFFSGESEEIEYDEDTVERELVEQFTRVREKVRFVRGAVETVVYDEVDWRHYDGVRTDKRSGVTVEQFYLVTGGKPIRDLQDHENRVKPEMERTEIEIVPGNVVSRERIEETAMELVVPVREEVKRHPETGEIESRLTPYRTGETEIRETDD